MLTMDVTIPVRLNNSLAESGVVRDKLAAALMYVSDSTRGFGVYCTSLMKIPAGKPAESKSGAGAGVNGE